MKTLNRILLGIVALILILLLVVGGWLTYAIRIPIPQVSGTIKTAGLSNPVDIYRDEWGIPHIYAQNSHDLFFAEGYVHAQERFWQMDLARRLMAGRFSEIFGARMLGSDHYFRTFGFAQVVEQEYQQLDKGTQDTLTAYAEGVNAYIASQSHINLATEILNVQGARYTPERWAPTDTLLWIKGMAWNMDNNLFAELDRVELLQKVGTDRAQELHPGYPEGRPLIVPDGIDFGALNVSKLLADTNRSRQLSNRLGYGHGSNSWALSGKLTDTGKPYLANDPHLGIQIPSTWYEVGLHCVNVSVDCPYNVTGVSFAGVPGVIIGHNEQIAWGFTNLRADVQDVYIERINPDNPAQYEVNGAWVDMQVRKETILVPGDFQPEPEKADLYETSYDSATGFTKVTFSVYTTRHGPILDSVEPLASNVTGSFADVQTPEHHAIALQWVAFQPNHTIRGILELDRAKNFDEFRAALRYFENPSQNIIYADVDGNIGYQAPGKIPVRAKGNGSFPVPGWTDEYEWQGYIPFEKLPYAYNPPDGYVVAANNAIVGPDFPYMISIDWDSGARAQRIIDLIQARKGQPITRDYITEMQADTFDLTAQDMVPYLKTLHFDDSVTQQALDSVLAWDFRAEEKSGPAAVYSIFWARFVKTAFGDELPNYLWPNRDTVNRLLKNPDSQWWDDITTPDKTEKRDDVLLEAFAAAYRDTGQALGEYPQYWQWGKIHTATFRESSMGNSGNLPLEALFNRGPYAVSGNSETINSTFWWIYNLQDSPADANAYRVVTSPSMRMIVDLGNLDNSLIINSTGQSGHPFHRHYDDMISLWLENKYHPQLWDRSIIEKSTEDHLQLIGD